jgi:hypothetical protein
MRVGIEREQTPVLARRYADQLGIRLELEQRNGELAIVAYEIQTGVWLKDLPGMGEAGCWKTWADSLSGLKELD